jgi:hypothetical protein
MRILNALLTLIMAVFAILQWNDPDAWLWIFIYGYVTLTAGLSFTGLRLKWFIIPGIIGLLIGIALDTPEFADWIRSGMPSITGHMKAESPFIEVIREFLGLLIALGVMVYLFFYDRSSRNQVER